VGLDAAGKTTILYKLKLGEIVTTIPTIGAFFFDKLFLLLRESQCAVQRCIVKFMPCDWQHNWLLIRLPRLFC
jgi:GTPase SAR1 family protein